MYPEFARRGVELVAILPLPMDQCHTVVESLKLNYPLYANPTGASLAITGPATCCTRQSSSGWGSKRQES